MWRAVKEAVVKAIINKATIKYAVDNDLDINLRPFIARFTDRILEGVLQYIREIDEEAYKILDTEKGRKWLERNIKRILECGD